VCSQLEDINSDRYKNRLDASSRKFQLAQKKTWNNSPRGHLMQYNTQCVHGQKKGRIFHNLESHTHTHTHRTLFCFPYHCVGFIVPYKKRDSFIVTLLFKNMMINTCHSPKLIRLHHPHDGGTYPVKKTSLSQGTPYLPSYGANHIT